MATRSVVRARAPEARTSEATAFLLALAHALHGVSLPADAIEARLAGVAQGLGLEMDVVVLESFFAAEIRNGSLPRVAIRRIPISGHCDLRRLAVLTALSEELAAGGVSLDEGRARLANILGAPPSYTRAAVTAACGVYAAVVAAHVGGAALEMLAAGLAGVVAGVIHAGALRSRAVDLRTSFLAALCGSLVVFVLARLLPPFDVSRALLGGMALLVPAMVIALGTHELVDAVQAGIARLTYGLLRVLAMTFGVTAAVTLWSLGGVLPIRLEAQPLPTAVTFALVAIGGVPLTLYLHGRGRDLPWIVAGGLLAYGAQVATPLGLGGRGSAFFAVLVVGVAAQLYALRPGHVAATILVPGLFLLAPGFLDPAWLRGEARVFDVLVVALQLVFGMVVAEILFFRAGRRRVERVAFTR